ncbi:MAG: hypothetical protein ACI835_005667 [Planctomycetota bacterium]|jgi:hypothetical protein
MIHSFRGYKGSYMGAAADGARDLNGDGQLDVLVSHLGD